MVCVNDFVLCKQKSLPRMILEKVETLSKQFTTHSLRWVEIISNKMKLLWKIVKSTKKVEGISLLEKGISYK